MSPRSTPNRLLAVDAAFVDLFQIDFNTNRNDGSVELQIRDDDQGGVIFRFEERATAERFCERLTATVERWFAPETPSIVDRIAARLSRLRNEWWI